MTWRYEMNFNPQTQRIALVTGDAIGIGGAISQRLAQDRIKVLVADMRAVDKGRTACGRHPGGRHRPDPADDHPSWPNWASTPTRFAAGPVDTPMTLVLHSETFRRQYTTAVSGGRYGLATEIAATAARLASDRAAYINGVALPVDGGFMASGGRGG